jgi:predicted nucleotidyltransferase
MNDIKNKALLARISDAFQTVNDVRAIALAGSFINGMEDGHSDFDIYVYSDEEISTGIRRELALEFSDNPEIDNRYWETGDEWTADEFNRGVDIMFRSPAWIEEKIARVLDEHIASVGYSTCFCFNIKNSIPLFDRRKWYAHLVEKTNRDYSDELKRNVILKNFPILRDTQSSYKTQIEKAIIREDIVGVNHRISALLASYFDIIFAINGEYHPGEKRLIAYTKSVCKKLPLNFEESVLSVLKWACRDRDAVLNSVDRLINGIEELIKNEDLI